MNVSIFYAVCLAYFDSLVFTFIFVFLLIFARSRFRNAPPVITVCMTAMCTPFCARNILRIEC